MHARKLPHRRRLHEIAVQPGPQARSESMKLDRTLHRLVQSLRVGTWTGNHQWSDYCHYCYFAPVSIAPGHGSKVPLARNEQMGVVMRSLNVGSRLPIVSDLPLVGLLQDHSDSWKTRIVTENTPEMVRD